MHPSGVCRKLVFQLDGPPTSKLTALGFALHVEATDEKRRAMNSALHRIGESQATNCDFMRWFGHVNYLNFAVAKIPMALYRGVMNMARNIARSGGLVGMHIHGREVTHPSDGTDKQNCQCQEDYTASKRAPYKRCGRTQALGLGQLRRSPRDANGIWAKTHSSKQDFLGGTSRRSNRSHAVQKASQA